MPLIVPSQTMALAWIELFGANSPILKLIGLAPAPGTTNPLYSAGGIALVMGVEHMPLAFMATRVALRALPADLVEAARILGIPARRIGTGIILPVVMPSVLAGSLVAFSAAIGNFGVPALGHPRRVSVLTTLIYQRLNGFGQSAAGQGGRVGAAVDGLSAVLSLVLRSFIMRRIAVPMPGALHSSQPVVRSRRKSPHQLK